MQGKFWCNSLLAQPQLKSLYLGHVFPFHTMFHILENKILHSSCIYIHVSVTSGLEMGKHYAQGKEVLLRLPPWTSHGLPKRFGCTKDFFLHLIHMYICYSTWSYVCYNYLPTMPYKTFCKVDNHTFGCTLYLVQSFHCQALWIAVYPVPLMYLSQTMIVLT